MKLFKYFSIMIFTINTWTGIVFHHHPDLLHDLHDHEIHHIHSHTKLTIRRRRKRIH